MSLQRHFLGASTPALHQAVDWLYGLCPPRRGPWDLHHLTIAVPGRRAVRRLTELLVERAGDAGLLTPAIVTPGDLPDVLFEGRDCVASELTANLTWIRAAASTAQLAALLPHPPDAGDLAAWWSLAQQFRSVMSDLAAADLEPGDVPRTCQRRGLPLPEPERWHALAAVDAHHQALLGSLGLVEEHMARRQALEQGGCRAEGAVVLIGVVDVTPLLAQRLRLLETEVVALVHGPQAQADAFDDLGLIEVDRWHERGVEIDDGAVRFADRPFDQGREAAVALAAQAAARSADGTGGLQLEDITVGLGDQGDVDAIRRALDLAGLPARYAAGRPMTQAPPVQFLAALARLADRGRVRDLADLLRHPDVGSYVEAGTEADQDWLTLLDGYAAEHLPDRIESGWLGNPIRAAALERLWGRVSDLLPETTGRSRPLPAWSEPILEALRRVYGAQAFDRAQPGPQPTLRALERLAKLLAEQGQLDPADAATPRVTCAGAIGLLLQRLEGETIPEEADQPAAELLGFLELPLDDAPALVITGLNEGRVPAARGPDPLLPDALRRALGLDDSRRRYARAVYALDAILRSRPGAALVAGRWSAAGDPLLPSRLLLAGAADTRVRRLDAFYRTIAEPAAVEPVPPLLLAAGGESCFLPPLPAAAAPLPEHLSVTALRDYIACPYRFYLKHVLGLVGPDEPGDEMDALLFGSLAHEVLQGFGASSLASFQDPQAIEDALRQALRQAAARRFGDRPRPAVAIQLDRLRARLRRFARVQAEQAAQGWRIHRVEVAQRLPFDVDGEPFVLEGRIDRVDVHVDGGVRIVDYKTSESARTPEQSHRLRRSEWVDLQLPLYRELVRPLGLEGNPVLAYFNLPKQEDEVGLSEAAWTPEEVDEAVDLARHILRDIRARRFWPPAEPARYGDEFVRLCADLSLDRPGRIERAERTGATGPV